MRFLLSQIIAKDSFVVGMKGLFWKETTDRSNNDRNIINRQGSEGKIGCNQAGSWRIEDDDDDNDD